MNNCTHCEGRGVIRGDVIRLLPGVGHTNMEPCPYCGGQEQPMDDHPPGTCAFCDKPAPYAHNYCSYECHIAAARADGAVEHLPNGLPIRCITGDGKLLEVANGDHPDYIFPVDVEGPPETIGDIEYPGGEFHALIYTDGNIALTLYECEYYLWLLPSGKEIKNDRKEYRISRESTGKIISWAIEHKKLTDDQG